MDAFLYHSLVVCSRNLAAKPFPIPTPFDESILWFGGGAFAQLRPSSPGLPSLLPLQGWAACNTNNDSRVMAVYWWMYMNGRVRTQTRQFCFLIHRSKNKRTVMSQNTKLLFLPLIDRLCSSQTNIFLLSCFCWSSTSAKRFAAFSASDSFSGTSVLGWSPYEWQVTDNRGIDGQRTAKNQDLWRAGDGIRCKYQFPSVGDSQCIPLSRSLLQSPPLGLEIIEKISASWESTCMWLEHPIAKLRLGLQWTSGPTHHPAVFPSCNFHTTKRPNWATKW